ncbi:MAG: FeoB-associated Cys-rich membrane protein [Magnetococcus sp. WYHC-3]
MSPASLPPSMLDWIIVTAVGVFALLFMARGLRRMLAQKPSGCSCGSATGDCSARGRGCAAPESVTVREQEKC